MPTQPVLRQRPSTHPCTCALPPCQVDFPTDDPIEIIKRLMIGSEGTLGFVSRVTYNTVPEWPHKASAFIVFPDVMSACQGASGARLLGLLGGLPGARSRCLWQLHIGRRGARVQMAACTRCL